jgi:exosortase/archaeosortase family protein
VFAWTAVPWPTNVEEFVMLKLRGFVTTATVAAMHAMRIHAVQHGNIIDLTNGSVLVDSACSGISSFQASIMASLFLGEYFRFSAWRRVLLVGAGSVLAVGGNLVRATILVRLASDWGAATMMEYHDRLGLAETVGIFIALVGVAWSISRNSPEHGMEVPAPPIGIEEGTRGGDWAGMEGWVVLLAAGALPLIIQGWFALSPGGPVRRQEAPMWLLNVKPVAADWREEPVTLSPMDIRTLGFTEGQTISVAGPSVASATIYHFFWKTDASTGFGHTPDICMRGGGWKEQGEPVVVSMRIKDTEFPGKLYWFKQDGEEDVVVFQSIWYGGEPMLSEHEFPYAKGGPRTSRLQMLWEEPRRRGLEALNVYMAPAGSQEAQTRVVGDVLAQVLTPNRWRGGFLMAGGDRR